MMGRPYRERAFAHGFFTIHPEEVKDSIPVRIGFYNLNEKGRISVEEENRIEQGFAAYWAGDLEAALAHFHKALEANPGNGSTYLNLGVIYHQAGLPSRALYAYEGAIRLLSKSPLPQERAEIARQAHSSRATLYEELGWQAKACADLEAAGALSGGAFTPPGPSIFARSRRLCKKL